MTPASNDDPVTILRSVLLHEAKLGHTDRATTTGVERFWTQWVRLVQATSPERAVALRRASLALSGYAAATHEARADAIRVALEALTERDPPRKDEAAPSPAAFVNGPASAADSTGSGARRERAQSPRPAARPRTPTIVDQAAGTLPSTPTQASVGRGSGSDVLNQPLTAVRGIGPALAPRLRKLGLVTVRDLLQHYPTRYIDYSDVKRVADLEDLGDASFQTIVATVVESRVEKTRSRGQAGGQWMFADVPAPRSPVALLRVVARLRDETGAVDAVWLRTQDYLTRDLTPGRVVAVSGVCRRKWSGLDLEFSNPDFEFVGGDEAIHTGRLVPVYAKGEGIGDRWLRRVMKRCLDDYAPRLVEFLPGDLRAEAGLDSLPAATSQIHFPDSERSLASARRRLAFDELLLLQLSVLRRRLEWRRGISGPSVAGADAAVARLQSGLRYQLTAAQSRSLGEILTDMSRATPMCRLLQGDVGSGKTVVAAMAAAAAIASGYQVAVMAPTGILAEQHFRTFSALCAGAELPAHDAPAARVALLTGSLRRTDRTEIRTRLAAGTIDLLVGTHALIQGDVEFAALGLVVVDEQHRFGVLQRDALRQKGTNPHLLVMTATPIPRSLALTVFGDLDLSVIDEMPPGRQAIRTRCFGPDERDALYASVKDEIALGHQAYVICPLVAESDRSEARAATAEHERLSRTVFSDARVGLLHGRMKSDDKEAVMRAFQRGELDVLVSTAVVEVGIDVPNATVIVIEGAERFGLSQLHQFRGRVGRGLAPSYCALLSDTESVESRERLDIVANTTDGFELAEHDLRLRGPGEFFGTRQSGLPDLKLASVTDLPLVAEARTRAVKLLEADPELESEQHRALAARVELFWKGGQVS